MTNLDLLAYIDKSIDNSEGQTYQWENDEVLEMLGEIRALAAHQPSEDARAVVEAAQKLDKWLRKYDADRNILRIPIAREMLTGFSRAAVPDAATEAKANAKIADLVYENASLKAERDAALAAVERVRAAVSGHPECDRYEEDDVISCGWKSAYARVLAALDGAPEPEGGVIKSPTWPDGCPMTVNELPSDATYRGHIDCQKGRSDDY